MKDNKNDPEINAASFSIEKFDLPSPIVKLAKVFFFFSFFFNFHFQSEIYWNKNLKETKFITFLPFYILTNLMCELVKYA